MKTDQETHSILAEYVRGHLEILNALPHPIFIVDRDFNIVFINNTMKVIYSDAGDLEHMKCYHLLHHSDSADENCPLTSFTKNRQTEQAEIYSPFLKKHLLVYSSPLIHKENLIGAIHSITDISKTTKSEKEYKELIEIYADTLNNMKVREQKAQTGREAFLNMLEDLNESYKELEELFIKLIRVMINALDAKSPWTKGHSERVSMYAEQIALEMSIDSEEVKNIRLAGILHDIGKIGTYDYLLDKPGKLTMEEYEIVKKHPAQGAVILQGIKQLRDIVPMIEYHHEKIDGTGYPYKLKEDEIPIGAKILHVADSFDSMTSDRPYRFAPGIEFALSELNKYRGKQFDPLVVDAFFKVLEKRKRIN
ncbi:MAG: HD domain-containing protein [Nitrospirae bacterium]|nr:HD domain-containing protein [Nitrospirota bacterium]